MAENDNNGVKITDLPESMSFDGLYTLGSNAGKAYKVSLSGWEAKRKEATAAAEAANTAARTATEAAAKVKDGTDGKTPVLGIGTVTDAASASATLVADGTDTNGNPKYKLNLSLPKGSKGDPGKDGTDGKDGEPGTDGTDGTDGADGIDGKTPVIGIGTVTTVADTASASATLVADGLDESGNPKYKLNLSLPKGEKGLPGTGSGNVSADGTGLVKDRKYLFVPSANDSTEGVFVEYTEPTIPDVPVKVSELENDAGYAVATDVATELEKKVDKVSGKGLSTNDYTDTDKAEVAKVAGKVDKVTGKGLSTNDYTTAEKQQVAKIATIQTSLAKKVEANDGEIEVEQGTYGARFSGTYNGYSQGGMEVYYGSNSSGDNTVTTFLHSDGNGLVIFETGRVRFRVNEQDRDFNDNPEYDIDANRGTIGNVAKIKFVAGQELVGGCPLKVVNETTGTVTLVRGMLHVISGQTTIDISVPAETDGLAGEYNAEIVTGETAPTVSFPASLKWDGGEAPAFEASKTYHIVIFRGVGYCSQGA